MPNYHYAQISGNSMFPILQDGDLIAISKNSEVRVGDIITFKTNQVVLTHRVISKDKMYKTKGDNSVYPEKSIDKGKIVGVAKYVIRKKTGKILELSRNSDSKRFLKCAVAQAKLLEGIRKITAKHFYHSIPKRLIMPIYYINYWLFLLHAGHKKGI